MPAGAEPRCQEGGGSVFFGSARGPSPLGPLGPPVTEANPLERGLAGLLGGDTPISGLQFTDVHVRTKAGFLKLWHIVFTFNELAFST